MFITTKIIGKYCTIIFCYKNIYTIKYDSTKLYYQKEMRIYSTKYYKKITMYYKISFKKKL